MLYKDNPFCAEGTHAMFMQPRCASAYVLIFKIDEFDIWQPVLSRILYRCVFNYL